MKKANSILIDADFDAILDGQKVSLFRLKNSNGVEISATNFGGRVVEIFTPDKHGNFADITIGHRKLDDYIHFKNERFPGAAVGRYVNRIPKGEFELNGRKYCVSKNNGENCLHGGFKSFDMRAWRVLNFDGKRLDMELVSPDGDEGFPAELRVKMSYSLNDENEFKIEYEGESDADTVINMTNHSYFNLNGEASGLLIDNHIAEVNADKFTVVDEGMITTGEIASVEGTPLDFRKACRIGDRLGSDFPQMKFTGGYDINYVLNKSSEGALDFAARITEPESGRKLEVFTTEPGIQFTDGNGFKGKTIGKGGKIYMPRCGVALETQHYPNSVNHPNFPSTILRRGEKYRHICIYKFGVI